MRVARLDARHGLRGVAAGAKAERHRHRPADLLGQRGHKRDVGVDVAVVPAVVVGHKLDIRELLVSVAVGGIGGRVVVEVRKRVDGARQARSAPAVSVSRLGAVNRDPERGCATGVGPSRQALGAIRLLALERALPCANERLERADLGVIVHVDRLELPHAVDGAEGKVRGHLARVRLKTAGLHAGDAHRLGLALLVKVLAGHGHARVRVDLGQAELALSGTGSRRRSTPVARRLCRRRERIVRARQQRGQVRHDARLLHARHGLVGNACVRLGAYGLPL